MTSAVSANKALAVGPFGPRQTFRSPQVPGTLYAIGGQALSFEQVATRQDRQNIEGNSGVDHRAFAEIRDMLNQGLAIKESRREVNQHFRSIVGLRPLFQREVSEQRRHPAQPSLQGLSKAKRWEKRGIGYPSVCGKSVVAPLV